MRFKNGLLIGSSTLAGLLFSTLSLADPQCTTEDPNTWQDQDEFRQQLNEQGYQIKKFKVTKTGCYEIYGHDKDGHKVEIYFNPVDGSIVKQKVN